MKIMVIAIILALLTTMAYGYAPEEMDAGRRCLRNKYYGPHVKGARYRGFRTGNVESSAPSELWAFEGRTGATIYGTKNCLSENTKLMKAYQKVGIEAWLVTETQEWGDKSHVWVRYRDENGKTHDVDAWGDKCNINN